MAELASQNAVVINGDTLHVMKIGKVCTVYVDMATGAAEPIQDYETPPETGFPVTLSQQDVEGMAAAQGKKIRYHEAQRAPERVAVDALPPAEMEQAINDVRKAPVVIPLRPDDPRLGLPQPPTDQSQIAIRVAEQFKLMLAKYSVASGKVKSGLKRDIEAVASFLISVDPGIEGLLVDWKRAATAPKFKL